MTETDTAPDTATPAENKSAASPGEMLRHARESLNLTLGDLAGQTRLSKAVLEALERNDFDNLAMPVYVRGYFRKCAHVMNMPEDKILQAYADWTGTSLTPQPLPVTVNEPPQDFDSPTRSSSWSYVLVIAIILGAALWWFGSGGESTRQPAVQTDAAVTTLDIAPPVLEPSPPLPLTDEVSTTNAGVSESPAQALATPETVEAPATVAVAPAVEQTGPAPGPNTLQLIVSQASWVSVTDDDDKQLIYDLLRPGTEQRVTGKPPYKVVLGHPQGVTMSIGGKPIDLVPYTSNNGTARLEVKAP